MTTPTTGQENATARPASADAPVWIVGVDGSDGSKRALEWALLHATPETVVRAVRAWQPPVYGPYPIDAVARSPYDDQALEASVRQEVTDLVEGTPNPNGATISISIERGGSARALLDESERASMLVVGNRGRGGFKRLLLGSVSSQCATHAVVPTVVVPADAAPVRTRSALVAFDGSPNAIDALVYALRFVGPDCPVTAIGIMEPGTVLLGYPTVTDGVAEDFDDQHAADLAEAVGLAGPGVAPVERRFEYGVATDVLGEAAKEHDLLVMGARGHGFVTSALLGSVSTWLLHHLQAPTMVVPRRG